MIALVLAAPVLAAQEETSQSPPRWDEKRARTWQLNHPWLAGCNYIPRNAVNTLEMWQAETFSPETIDQELGWAESLGFNVVRVFLHWLPWETDSLGYVQRLGRFLEIADKHHIGIIFVLFDDCWNPEFRSGPQPSPRQGVHNSGWVQCPGSALLTDPEKWTILEFYTRGILGRFGRDPRILAWDLYNEPGNSEYGPKSLPLLREVFRWARSAETGQPLTSGVWDDAPEQVQLNAFMIESSDIISFHSYLDEEKTGKRINALKIHGRPLLCTEYMARTAKSRFDNILPLLKKENVGAINWGLVSGKTQTIFPWGSKPGSPEPATWFHDIFRADGSPFDPSEVLLIRKLTGKSDGE